jgi:dUTP pyrophosphatase
MLNLPDEALRMMMTDEGKEAIRNTLNTPDNMKMFSVQMAESKKSRAELVDEVHALRDQIPLLQSALGDGFSPTQDEFFKYFMQSMCEMAESVVENLELFDAEIFTETVHDNAKVPVYVHETDAGADIYAVESIELAPQARGVILKTGLKVAIPYGWQLAVRPRSGNSVKTTKRIANSPGTIDSGYRDEVGIIVDNISDDPLFFETGSRIAQFVLERVYKAKFTKIDSVKNIGENRGGGFGSTGN